MDYVLLLCILKTQWGCHTLKFRGYFLNLCVVEVKPEEEKWIKSCNYRIIIGFDGYLLSDVMRLLAPQNCLWGFLARKWRAHPDLKNCSSEHKYFVDGDDSHMWGSSVSQEGKRFKIHEHIHYKCLHLIFLTSLLIPFLLPATPPPTHTHTHSLE